jgi:hypothetical protein
VPTIRAQPARLPVAARMAPGGHSGWLIDLDLLDGRERLRWLVRPAAGSDLRR